MKVLALLSLSLVLQLPVSVGIAAFPTTGNTLPFQGENLIDSNGSSFGRFVLAQGATLSFANLSTNSENAALIVEGEPTGAWLLKAGESWAGGVAGHWFPAGTYFVYVISDPPVPSRAVLRFDELPGSSEVVLAGTAPSAIRNLPSTALQAGVERYGLAQPFEGQAFGLIFTIELPTQTGIWSREWRMSTGDGVIYCDSSVGQASPGALLRYAAFWDGGNRLPLNMTYFRQGTVPVKQDLLGYWIGRAPDDVPKFSGIFTVPAWGLTDGKPLLDQDALCARSVSGQAVGGVTRTIQSLVAVPTGV